jgi:NO-binding membrane sensor protein with MHYT domain
MTGRFSENVLVAGMGTFVVDVAAGLSVGQILSVGLLLVGLGVGAAHYVGHAVGGEEWAYEDAGVMTAGITVTMAAAVATFIVLSVTGVA